MLGHRLDETRVGRIIAERAPQGTDTLGQRLVRHRNAAPDLVVEAFLGHQPARIAQHQHPRIEIACAAIDRRAVAFKAARRRIEREFPEFEAVGVQGRSSLRAHAASRRARPARAGYR